VGVGSITHVRARSKAKGCAAARVQAAASRREQEGFPPKFARGVRRPPATARRRNSATAAPKTPTAFQAVV